MKIRLIATSLAIVSAFASSPEAALPAGSLAHIRLADYINTEHQPLGYTVRGIVEGDITEGGKVVIADKSKVLMRLVAEPLPSAALTVELWAVKFGNEWGEFRSAPGSAGLFTILKGADDRRPPKPDDRPLIIRGTALYIPFQSILHFEMRHPVRLINVGSYRP